MTPDYGWMAGLSHPVVTCLLADEAAHSLWMRQQVGEGNPVLAEALPDVGEHARRMLADLPPREFRALSEARGRRLLAMEAHLRAAMELL